MTPKQATKNIGKQITVKTFFGEVAQITIVRCDRWNVFTSDGGVFDRGDLTIIKVAKE